MCSTLPAKSASENGWRGVLRQGASGRRQSFKNAAGAAGAAIHGVCPRTTPKSAFIRARARVRARCGIQPPAPPKAGAEVPRQVDDYEQQNRPARTGLIRLEELTNNIGTTQPRLLDFFLYNPGLKDCT